MRFPFVSRERLDAAERYLTVAHAEARRERDIADARYDALLDKYQALRVAGAVEVPKPPVESMAFPAHPAVDELKTLIHERCGSDYRKRAAMLRQLALDRASNVSEEKIRDAIEQGVSSDGVPA